MIVDDMPIFLEYLRGAIEWEQYGFEICAQAMNGKEALEKMDQCYPDVIITDITMPYMDGLELAEKVMENYPDIAVILLTGNSEFEYARRALKIGVCDYIVKPFEIEELVLSLLKLQDNMERTLESLDIYSEKEVLLRKSILGNKEEEERWRTDLREVGISFSSDYYLLGCIHFKVDEKIDFETFLNWENILISMMKNTIHVNGQCEVFRDFQNDIVFILNFEDEKVFKEYKAYELGEMPKIIEKHIGVECSIGISDYCQSLRELKVEYYRMQEILKKTQGNKLVKFFQSKEARQGMESIYEPQFLAELNDALMNRDKEGFTEFWKQEWEYAYGTGNNNFQMQLLSSLLGMLFTDIINSGKRIEDVYGEEFRPHVEIYSIQEPEKRVSRLHYYFEKWLDVAMEKKFTASEIVAERARQYILDHYMEGDLSITRISRELLINQTYLRRMFKEETGMTLWEFLTEYRMQKAKQLLLYTDHGINKIAEMVGYNDVGYFGKCFKKYYHVSPKQMLKEK